MSQVIIRNLDPEVVVRLKKQAQFEDKSLEQKLREILEKEARPDKAELRQRAATIRAMSARPHLDAVALIRQDRDQ